MSRTVDCIDRARRQERERQRRVEEQVLRRVGWARGGATERGLAIGLDMPVGVGAVLRRLARRGEVLAVEGRWYVPDRAPAPAPTPPPTPPPAPEAASAPVPEPVHARPAEAPGPPQGTPEGPVPTRMDFDPDTTAQPVGQADKETPMSSPTSLELIRQDLEQHPWSTVAEIADRTGLVKTTVYAALGRAKDIADRQGAKAKEFAIPPTGKTEAPPAPGDAEPDLQEEAARFATPSAPASSVPPEGYPSPTPKPAPTLEADIRSAIQRYRDLARSAERRAQFEAAVAASYGASAEHFGAILAKHYSA